MVSYERNFEGMQRQGSRDVEHARRRLVIQKVNPSVQ